MIHLRNNLMRWLFVFTIAVVLGACQAQATPAPLQTEAPPAETQAPEQPAGDSTIVVALAEAHGAHCSHADRGAGHGG